MNVLYGVELPYLASRELLRDHWRSGLEMFAYFDTIDLCSSEFEDTHPRLYALVEKTRALSAVLQLSAVICKANTLIYHLNLRYRFLKVLEVLSTPDRLQFCAAGWGALGLWIYLTYQVTCALNPLKQPKCNTELVRNIGNKRDFSVERIHPFSHSLSQAALINTLLLNLGLFITLGSYFCGLSFLCNAYSLYKLMNREGTMHYSATFSFNYNPKEVQNVAVQYFFKLVRREKNGSCPLAGDLGCEEPSAPDVALCNEHPLHDECLPMAFYTAIAQGILTQHSLKRSLFSYTIEIARANLPKCPTCRTPCKLPYTLKLTAITALGLRWPVKITMTN